MQTPAPRPGFFMFRRALFAVTTSNNIVYAKFTENFRQLLFSCPILASRQIPNQKGGAVGFGFNTGSSAYESKGNRFERRVGFWSDNRRQRRDYPGRSRQNRQFDRQSRGRLRGRQVARPGRSMPSVCRASPVPNRLSHRPARPALLAQLIGPRGARTWANAAAGPRQPGRFIAGPALTRPSQYDPAANRQAGAHAWRCRRPRYVW